MYKKMSGAIVVLLLLFTIAAAGCTSNVTESGPSVSNAPTSHTSNGTPSSVAPTSSAVPTPASAKSTASNSKISVTADYRGVYGSDNPLIQPKAGNKYVQFYVTVTNVNYPLEIPENPAWFKLVDSKAQVHDPAAPSYGESSLGGDLKPNPGEKITGLLVFEIAQDANPVKFVYNDFANNLTINV
jgi:hypothetical protein